MKKVLIIISIIIMGIVLLYFGLLYHARMTASDWGGMINPDAVIGEDGEYYIPDDLSDDHMLDGDFTYVDNEKLLERICGEWISNDGRYRMKYDDNYQMTITENDVDVFSATAQFSYLQPGEVSQTDFSLNQTILKDSTGNDYGEIDYCYHFVKNDEDIICMNVFLLDNQEQDDYEIIIQFKKLCYNNLQ